MLFSLKTGLRVLSLSGNMCGLFQTRLVFVELLLLNDDGELSINSDVHILRQTLHPLYL